MVHRILSIPMSEEDYNTEKVYIYNTATVNGYDSSFVDKIFKKHLENKRTRQKTSLQRTNERTKIISLPYFPKVTLTLSRILHRYNIHTITRNSKTLKNELYNIKDKQPPLLSSGIYEVSCENCEETYIGQTRRTIKDRFKEHHRATEQKLIHKSSVAEHMVEHNHEIKNIKRKKMVTDNYKLDAWESLFMKKYTPEMNRDPPPISSYLYELASLQIR